MKTTTKNVILCCTLYLIYYIQYLAIDINTLSPSSIDKLSFPDYFKYLAQSIGLTW